MTAESSSPAPGAGPAADEPGSESGLLRMIEAILFAAENPLSVEEIGVRLPGSADVEGHLRVLERSYENRGVNLVRLGGRYQFRTAPDLAFLMRREVEDTRRLSRAAVETLAIIAYHQPVTRGEIEEIRGVGLSKGTLDVLMEAGWVRPKGRRRTPGRPLQYATSEDFLAHFGLASLDDLPGLAELRAAGMLDSVDDALDRMAADQEAQAAAEAAPQIDLEDAIDASEGGPDGEGEGGR